MFKRRRSQDDFKAEIDSHLQLEEDQLAEEGLKRQQINSAARRAFGNRALAEERFYEARPGLWFDRLRQDLKYAIRTLSGAPGFTLAAVITLALGIGANTGVFSVVYGALLKQLPYPEPDRLVILTGIGDSGRLSQINSPGDLVDYQTMTTCFENIGVFSEIAFNLTGPQPPMTVSGAVVTPNLLQVLEVSPLLGRTISPSSHGPREAVLSYALWRSRYGADPGIVGTAVDINGEPMMIVGVMPKGFEYPRGNQLWVSSPFRMPPHPLNPLTDNSTSRDSHYLENLARLKPGVTLAQANQEVERVAELLKQQYGDNEEYQHGSVQPLRDNLVGDTRPALLILLGAVTVLLLITCVNVANLVLARGATRQREIAIRLALGAGRIRIVRQLLTENLLLAVGGGALGIAAARLAIAPLKILAPPGLGAEAITVDTGVLIFTASVSLLSALIFGLIPAMQMASASLNNVLKEGGRGAGGGPRARRTRNVLVISEVALATVLLIGAGLLIRSFSRLLATPEGFSPEHVLTVQLSLPQARYPQQAERARFVRQMIEKVDALPGVRSASVISRLPLDPGRSTRSMDVEGRTPPPEGDPAPDYLVISPDYFRAMGIPLISGRTFSDADAAGSQFVGIVSESTARYFWPGENPIGKRIQVGAQQGWSPVVGVVSDIKQHRLDDAPKMTVYLPYAQDPWSFMTLAVRADVDPGSLSSSVQSAVHSVDSEEPVRNIRTMNEVVAQSVSPERSRMILLGAFAAVAAALACVGIYGVIAYSVAERKNEIGVRLALGASPRRVVSLVVTQGLTLGLAGTVAGLGLSFAAVRLMSGLIYGIRATDALTFTAVCVLLGTVALLASCVPACRAARLNPVAALREE